MSKLEKAAAKARATQADRRIADEARATIQAVLNKLDELDATLAPYEQIRTDLAEARGRYRELSNAFVDELRHRCDALEEEEKRELVLELFARDVQASLDGAVSEKRQILVRFIEWLWDKYRVTLADLSGENGLIEAQFDNLLGAMGYR